MTSYTETKRRLQRLGFKVVNRFGDRDVLLEHGGTKIRLAADCCGHEAMYAALENGVPVSWHNGSRRCNTPGKWLGLNYNIEVSAEEELNDRELELFYTMYGLAHAGQYITNLEQADF